MSDTPQPTSEERATSKRIGALKGLWPFMGRYRGLLALALGALVSTAVVSLALPLAVRRVVDGFQDGDLALLNQYFLAALIIAGLLALGTATRYYLVTRLGERVVADIRRALFERVIGLSPAFYERIMTGEVLSRLTTDTTLIQSIIGSSVSIALRNALLLVGGLIMLTLTSPKLTGLVLLIVPAIIVPIVVLGRRLRRLSRENQDWIAASSGNASEALGAVQTVQAFTHEIASITRFNRVTERSFDTALRRVATRAVMTAIVIFLVFAGIVGVLWVGALDVRAGAMTVGELVQFVIYSVIVAGSVGALSETWSELQRAAGATERLVELLSATDSINDPATPLPLPAPVKGAVGFEAVRFHYPSRPGQSALDGITLRVRPGETVALVGPSGAGKTTIIQLLMRFFDPQEGRVTLDGQDIRQLARRDLRSAMALVPQDPVIFATTARENIRFGRPDASDAEIEEAARAAAAHDFITALPQGYDTELGERGVMLSGGQKQRIAIARAILRDAPVLLLDEATSALDAESERAVQAAVERLARGRTTVTHGARAAQGGLYARLARLQFTASEAA